MAEIKLKIDGTEVTVERGKPILDAAQASGDPGGVEEGLGEGGLAAPAVADEHDIPNSIRGQGNLLRARRV